MLLFDDFQSLDLTGPLEVLEGATRLIEREGQTRQAYSVQTATLDGKAVRSSSGLKVVPDASLEQLTSLHTVLIVGGEGVDAAIDAGLAHPLLALIARSQPERIVSVCTGALLLAATGLLDGRTVATHWASCSNLRARHPNVTVERNALYVEDGPFWTSAGVTAGMDLALSLVERDLGRDTALRLARWLVLFLHRPGGQSQFSAQLAHQMASHDGLRAVQAWVVEHPDADCSNAVLARKAGMSPRSFSRRFKAEVGSTPARFVQAVRVDAARRLLERESLGLETVAERCGFGSSESMRRGFIDLLAVPPSIYRQRFRTQETS